MKNLRDILKEAERKGIAVGHFNFSNFEQLKAVVGAARKLNLPVVLGLSEGERDFIGVKESVLWIQALRKFYKHPIFLNADHTYSVERVREAAEAGFDSVIFDGAKSDFEVNLTGTREAVRTAKKINRDILVEGELGYIGQSSQVVKEIPAGAAIEKAMFTTPEQAEKFAKEAKIDLFAPAVGNVHGIVISRTDADGTWTYAEKLDVDLIREIAAAVKIPLVLHGGSGLVDEDFKNGITAGIRMVHISTELRAAWKAGVEKSIGENPNEYAPYRLLQSAVLDVEETVERKMKLFANLA